MSVADGLIAILSLGPQYGSQLTAEFLARAPHRPRLNAGQVHTTLERLADRGLVTTAGTTDDGLPLYAVTATGARAARDALSGSAERAAATWDDMLDDVLVAASIAGADAVAVAHRHLDALDFAASSDARREVTRAASISAAAAIDAQRTARRRWLAEVLSALEEDRGAFVRPLPTHRPRRGRPSAA